MARKVPPKVAITVIILTIAFMAYSANQSRNTVVEPVSWARVGCEGAVKAKLAAPTTAKIEWAGFGLNPSKKFDHEYALQGRVTSQNYFGAMLTKDFMCYNNGKQDFRANVVIAP